MPLTFKPGVKIEELHDSIVELLPKICQVYSAFGKTCVVTSGSDGKHMVGSYHYTRPLRAIDLRTYYFNSFERFAVLDELQRIAGPDFDVILESDHIHLEYDP